MTSRSPSADSAISTGTGLGPFAIPDGLLLADKRIELLLFGVASTVFSSLTRRCPLAPLDVRSFLRPHFCK